MFKVGQKVWSVDFGWGVVRDIEKSTTYPVEAYFASTDSFKTYTIDGKVTNKLFRSLFFEEFPIPETALKPPRWRAKFREKYYCVDEFGSIYEAIETVNISSNTRYKVGNYFQTEQEAKDSDIYKAYNR